MTTTVTIAVNEFTASGPVALLGHSITFKPVPIHIDSTTDTVLSEDIWEVPIVDGVSTTLIPDSVSGYGVRIGANIQGWKFVTVANYPVGTISLADLVNNYAVNPTTLEPTPAPDSWWTALANLVDNSVAQANQYTDTQITDVTSGIDADIAASLASANGYTDTKSAAVITTANGYADGKVAAEVTRADAAYAPIGDLAFATLDLAVAAVATGGVLEVRKAWSRSTPLVINKAMTLRFIGGSITQTTDTVAISVTANNVTIDRPVITGTGAAVSGVGAGIAATGSSAASPATGLRIIRPVISGFAQYGISLIWCKDFVIEKPKIDTIAYGAIMMSSCSEGDIKGGSIKNLTQPSPLTNSYGIAASFNEAAGIATYPQSRDITIDGVLVDGVPLWEGIDTHAGINIKVINCTVKNCRTGIAFVPGRNGGASYVLAPKNATIANNTIDSGYTNGTLSLGIQIVGCSTGVGFQNNSDFATGTVTGNKIIECGNDLATTGCAMAFQDTLGVVVANNLFINPVTSAIRLDYNNKDAALNGNVAIDVWTNTAAYAVMIQTSSAWNTAKLSGNVLTRGAKTATIVNGIGLRIGSATATSIVEQGNDFQAATTPYSLATPIIRFDMHGIKNAFVTAIPASGVWQGGGQALLTAPAAASSPGWVCTTAGGASSATWAATTAYSSSTWIKTSTGKVLECVTGGTSSGTEPTPTTIDGVFTDGTVTWVYRSATSAVFKAKPAVAA